MDNRTVGFLVTTLEKCKLYRAADYILENILGGKKAEFDWMFIPHVDISVRRCTL